MKHDFPEFVTLSSIGKSHLKRDIDLMVVDARSYVLAKDLMTREKVSMGQVGKDDIKPAILITGQHHAREHITPEITLYSMLKMIHGGIFNED